jgi:uncharacterized protein HemX
MNLQMKAIGILIAIILMLGLGFQSFRLKVSNDKQKALQSQINSLNEQNEKNKLDLESRNNEITNNQGKINDLQNKIKTQFKNDNCINSLINNEFLELLYENTK